MNDRAPVHASVVAFGAERGVVILGPSGSGKSRLALGLIEQGAHLVGDDRVHLIPDRGALFARVPRSIAGLIEVRGLGILRLPHLRLARVVLAIDLEAPMPRLALPEPRVLAGITVPCLPGAADATFSAALARYVTGASVAV